MANAKKRGAAVLGSIAHAAVSRLVAKGGRPQHLFNDAERKQLAHVFAAVNGTAELLGRARVRQRQDHAEKHKGAKFSDDAPFEIFVAEGSLHPMAPREAVDYFTRLAPRLGVDPGRFGQRLERSAFTLAEATDQAVLERVRSTIADRLATGKGTHKAIEEILDQAGISPRNPQYGEMTMRTNMMDSYTEGAMKELQDPDVAETFPVWKYLGIRDGRQGKDHEPHFDRYYPNRLSFQEVRGPRVFNCVLPGNLVQGRFSAALKAWYSGEAVEITTAAGMRLTLTVNHPVLAGALTKAAGRLEKGDYLWAYFADGQAAPGQDIENRPARIEDVFDSFAAARQRIAGASFDLDGDGAFVEGDIEIVRPYGNLPQDAQSGDAKDIGQIFLEPADAGSMRGGDLAEPLAGGHFRPLDCLGLAGATGLDSGHEQALANRPTVNAITGGQDIFRQPLVGIEPDEFLHRDRLSPQQTRFGAASELDIPLPQPAADGLALDTFFLGELTQRFAGKIALDQIVNVRPFHYRGPVYDLETEPGYFTCSDTPSVSALIRNCRCDIRPVSKWEWQALREAGQALSKFSEQRLCRCGESPAAKILDVPDVRQTDHFSCGAAAAMVVGRYFGVGPATLPEWKKALGTDVEESTRPQAIIAFLRSLGLPVSARPNMRLADLDAAWRRGHPVICPVQDYGRELPKEADFDYGHYLVVIGLTPGYVICQDSSEDNVTRDSGTIAAPGRVLIREADWLRDWHDQDIDGNQYLHFGIEVSQLPSA